MKNTLHFILRVLLLAISLLLAIGLLLACLAQVVPPDKFHCAAFCGVLFAPLFWGNVLCAVLWIFSSKRIYGLLPLIFILISLPALFKTYSHGTPLTTEGKCSPTDSNPESVKQLSVLTYNTHQCQMARKTPYNEVLRYVRESGADIVFLQEYEVRKNNNQLTFSDARQYLEDTYHYTYFDFALYNNFRQYGIAVFSRYPLINKRTIRYESAANISDCCDVIVGSDTIRLFNNHLESNRLTADDIGGVTDEKLSSEGVRRSFVNLTEKMRKAYKYRAHEVKTVSAEIAASPYPVIVAGDMNDVPVSYTYNTIKHARKNMQDCFLLGSAGRKGHTYLFGSSPWNNIFGVRIDYLFVSDCFKVADCRTDNVPYSDHLPLRTELLLIRTEEN